MKPVANLQTLADQLLLQHFSPAAVLVNDKGDILYINGRTGKYLEPAAGKANWNIFAMVREGLQFHLGMIFQQAVRKNTPITAHGLKVKTNSGVQIVDITIQVIEEPEALRGMVLIVFTDVPTPPGKKDSVAIAVVPTGNASVIELEEELRHAREELQTNCEDMQISQEELTTTNEELQSTNEELTTSREEMQSLNEELQMVNSEQHSKMDELSRVNNDMRNLLNSTEIVTIFLDNNLHIRRFTTGADTLFKLIPADVGRPLSDIVSDLLYPELIGEAREVLRSLVFSEKKVATGDGRWFSVRIMLYRSTQDLIAGVVLTFINITAAKTLEKELRLEIALLKGQLAA